jgi:hypothetical protein
MEEENQRNGAIQRPRRDEFFSKVVRASRRTYFFDVKVNQESESYVTISESKRCIHPDGRPFYEKHKIFLYSEDFEEFSRGLSQVTDYVRNHAPKIKADSMFTPQSLSKESNSPKSYGDLEETTQTIESYSNVNLNFEDLGNK